MKPKPYKIKGPIVSSRIVKPKTYSRFIGHKRIIISLLVFFGIVISFAGGIDFASQTPRIEAVDKSVLNLDQQVPAGLVANLIKAPANASPTSLSNDAIFNTPLEVLQEYYQTVDTGDSLKQRKQKLKTFLAEHNSPLVDQADIIAEQPHWQLILAISFAESTLGKKCYMFNCSGIGGANIKTYKNFEEWIVDFNRLIDKRYNQWTLDEMCGVYVKPCTNNWLNATKQILEELKLKLII